MIAELLCLIICLFHTTIKISKKLRVPTKRATTNLIKVKSCGALLLMPLSLLKSVLRYKFLILGTCHLHTIFT